MRNRFLALAIVGVVTAGCGKEGARLADGPDGPPVAGGTIVISAGGDPDVLFPPLMTAVQSRQVTDLVYEHLANVGDSLNVIGDGGFEPGLASSWRWAPDSLSIAFQLDSAARFHDGVPVRASDVAFTFALYVDPATASPYAPLLSSIDSVTAPDSLTAVFWFDRRSPTQFFDAVYTMLVLPQHRLRGVRGRSLRSSELARNPVGSGPYRFVRWQPAASLELAADTSHRSGPPRISRLIWSIAPDFNTALARLLGREADLLEQIPAPALEQLSSSDRVRISLLPGFEYNFVQFNLRDPEHPQRPHPLFANRELRRALSMAVDRRRVVQSVYDSLAHVAVGPTVRTFPSTDTSLAQLPYDPAAAARILDSLGWQSSGGGAVRQKQGRPLEFTLSVPSSSLARSRMAVLLQEQFRAVGVRLNLDQLEFTSFVDRQTRGRFDAAFGSWHTDPGAGGIRQTWGSTGPRGRGGSNYGSYESPAFDALVDSALTASSAGERRRYFTLAYRSIVADAPAIWMAEPRAVLAVDRRIRTGAIRPVAWWSGLPRWWIPESERIARDMAP